MDCHLFHTYPEMSLAAENITIKPIIQRIKTSPNHTDLIRQITNWQVAILADLPINAQNKAACSLWRTSCSVSPERLRATRPGQCSQRPRRGLELPAPDVTAPETAPRLHLATGPSHSEAQERTGSLCFCPGASKAVFLAEELPSSAQGQEVGQFVKNSN